MIKGFECPHNFGHHKQAGDKLDLAFDRLPKKRFDSFRFRWIVVGQKMSTEVRVDKDLSHDGQLFVPHVF